MKTKQLLAIMSALGVLAGFSTEAQTKEGTSHSKRSTKMHKAPPPPPPQPVATNEYTAPPPPPPPPAVGVDDAPPPPPPKLKRIAPPAKKTPTALPIPHKPQAKAKA